MARKKYQPRQPQSGQEPGEPNSDGLNPLEHGHVAGVTEGNEEAGSQEDQEEASASSEPKSKTTLESIQAQMLAMEARHAEEVANLRRQIPPTAPKTPEPPPADDKLDELLFTNPKEAVAKIKEAVGKDIEAKLTKRYSQAENTRRFWEAFDKAHPDLQSDRDLVELTMNANLDKIANIPVEQAMEKLADLTRDRIRRYTGSRPKPKKAFAEGSGAPLPRPTQEEPPAVVSIGELIKRRRAAKHGKASAA